MKVSSFNNHIQAVLLLLTSLIIFTLFLLGCGLPGEDPVIYNTVSIELVWQETLENEDGSTATDIENYRIYYSQIQHHFTRNRSLEVSTNICNASHVCTYLIQDIVLETGAWYLVVTTEDNLFFESTYSNSLQIQVPIP